MKNKLSLLSFLFLLFSYQNIVGQSVSISPTSGQQNSTFGVTVTGVGTTWASSSTNHCVQISNGVSSFNFVGTSTASTTITGTLTIPPDANVGANYNILVYDAGDGSCSGPLDGTCGNCFEVTADPLPLELIAFTVDALDERAKLQWKIASPQNVKGYEIQRGSKDQQTGTIEWKVINFIPHSDYKLIYDFVDITPSDGINYYRLKMIDLDGSFEWSPIKSLNFVKREKQLAGFYPNPMSPSQPFFIDVKTQAETPIEILIVNQSGQLIKQINFQSEEQQQYYPIDLGNIANGYFIARIKIGEEVVMRSFVVSGK